MSDNISPSLFTDIKDQSKKLESENATKVENFKASVNAYMMEWEDDDRPGAREGLKLTISPTARFSVMGAYNLMTATEPIITVKKQNEVVDNLRNDKIEGFLRTLLRKSGEMEGTETHLDASLSALLFSEVHIAIDLTSEIAKKMKEGTSKAQKRQAETIEVNSPLRFRVFNPTTGFYRRGPAGLAAYYHKEDITRGELRVSFPKILPGNDARQVTLNEWWDLEWHVVWIEGEEPLVAVQHDLPYIPVVVSIANGSNLFPKPEQNSQPFLYTFVKSGLHGRESLMLTVMFTKLFQYGLTPPLIIEGGMGNDTFRLDTNGVLPVGYTSAGSRVSYPMANIIDPNVYNLYELTRNLGEQSTIYRQALGAPLQGGNNPFSTIALLSQAGRLPLTGPQRAASKALAEAFRVGIEILKDQGLTNHELLKDVDLEDKLEIDVKLDVKIPQDVFRNAQIGSQVTSGEGAIVSKEWWWENAMGVQDTDGMRQKIMTEQSYAMAFGLDLQMEIEKRKAMASQGMQTGTPTGIEQPEEGAEMPTQGEPMTAEGPMTAPIEQGGPQMPGTGQEGPPQYE